MNAHLVCEALNSFVDARSYIRLDLNSSCNFDKITLRHLYAALNALLLMVKSNRSPGLLIGEMVLKVETVVPESLSLLRANLHDQVILACYFSFAVQHVELNLLEFNKT